MESEQMTALILASAPEREYDYVRELAQQADCIVCADGGVRHARACGLHPDLVIGDFDSGTLPADCEVIRLKPEKDDSDLMCCAREAIRRGADTIWIACASGGRIDHFLANLFLLEYLGREGIDALFFDFIQILTRSRQFLSFLRLWYKMMLTIRRNAHAAAIAAMARGRAVRLMKKSP